MKNLRTKHALLVFGGLGFVLVIVLVIAMAKLSAKKEPPPAAIVPVTGTQVETAPITPAYEQRVADLNQKKLQEAQATGTSVLPVLTPKEEPVKTGLQPVSDVPVQSPSNDPSRAQYDQQRAQAYLTQVNKILAGWGIPVGAATVLPDNSKNVAATKGDAGAQPASQASAATVPIVSGGTEWFGKLRTPINTDAPGDVIVDVISGPYANTRMWGKATRRDELIRVELSQWAVGGKTLPVNVVALDMESGNSLLSGEVDRKLMERFGWPFLAAAVSGWGQAKATTGSTTAITSAGAVVASQTPSNSQIFGSAIGQGANAVAGGLNAAASAASQKKVTKEAEEVIALYFLADVTAATVAAGKSSSAPMQQEPQITPAVQPAVPQQAPQGYQTRGQVRLPNNISIINY